MDSPTKDGTFDSRETIKNRSQFMFFAQIIVIYIVIITSLFNISFKNGDSQLWIALLGSAIGYILPAPKLKTYGGATRIL
jgi:hypothetical protein